MKIIMIVQDEDSNHNRYEYFDEMSHEELLCGREEVHANLARRFDRIERLLRERIKTIDGTNFSKRKTA